MHIQKVYSTHKIMRENTNVKKIPLGKINGTKNALFFFNGLQLISFTFNL